jgi:hypothetical protein
MNNASTLKRALLAGATCVALSATPLVHAGVLVINSISGQAVTFNYNNANFGTTAGAFTGTFDGNPLTWWCVDLAKHVTVPGGPYNDYTAAPFQSPPLGFSAGRQADLQRLFTNDFGLALTTAQNSAAFQIAIWDILFDNDANISTYGGAGQFGISSGNAATIALAQSWVSGLGSGSASYPLYQLTSPSNQDFITPTLPGLVPEPSALSLLGAGFVAMMLALRRRRVSGHPA